MMFEFVESNNGARIKVIGIGGGIGRAVGASGVLPLFPAADILEPLITQHLIRVRGPPEGLPGVVPSIPLAPTEARNVCLSPPPADGVASAPLVSPVEKTQGEHGRADGPVPERLAFVGLRVAALALAGDVDLVISIDEQWRQEMITRFERAIKTLITGGLSGYHH